MKKNLSFDTPQVEQSFKNGVFVRNFDIIRFTIMIYIIINGYKILTEIKDVYWLMSLFRIIVSFLILFISMAFLNLNKLETSYTIRWLMEVDIILNILIETKIVKTHEKISKVFITGAGKTLKNFCQVTPLDYLDIFPTCDLQDSTNMSLSPLSKQIILKFFIFY